MATVSIKVDTQLSVFKRAGNGPAVGFDSKYSTTPHPGTGNPITGFKFDESRWGVEENDNFSHFVPTLWDGSSLGTEFVAGIGDGRDLFSDSAARSYFNFQENWRPVINHGYYYSNNHPYYLFSDTGLTTCIASGVFTPGGGNQVQLERNPKPGIPVLARGYKWNDNTGEYILDREILKKIKFTGLQTPEGEALTETNGNIFWDNISTAQSEFILDYNTNPVTALFNRNVIEEVGAPHPTASGLTLADLELLDTIGVTTSERGQQYRLTYSPVDRNSPVNLFLDYGGSGIQKWDIVDSLTSGVFNQATIDYDLGIIRFGDEERGGLPPYGATLRASYSKTVGIEYEPENTTDKAINVLADLNPIRRFTGSGFVYLRRDVSDVRRIVLSAELPEIEDDFYGPLFLGNSFARIRAQAFSSTDEPVEGVEIGFELLGIQTGRFGSNSVARSISNGNGVAFALYNPPRTIEGLGGATNQVNTASGISSLFIDNYSPPDGTESLFLFQVAREDHVLGIPRTQLNKFYEDYIQEEGGGPEFSFSLGSEYSWITGILAPKIKWEVYHREVHGLLTPVTYEEGDLRTGKKTVLAHLDSSAINPHTGSTPAVAPVQPSHFETTATGTSVHFSQQLPDITSSGLYKSYMVVGPTKARMRAFSFNPRLNTVVYSNEIEVLIQIPESAAGLYHIDAINSMPSGLLTNARYFNQEEIPLEEVPLSTTGIIPLGFRIRSPGITIASALDGVTFLDLNPLDLMAPTEIAHKFEVD